MGFKWAALGHWVVGLIPGLAMVAAVFAMGMAAERNYGTGAKLVDLRKSLPDQLETARKAGLKAQADVDRPVFDKWDAALAECRLAQSKVSQAAAAAITGSDAFTNTQAAAAYRLGRATCGADHAPATDPAVPADAGGMHDSDEDFAHAFARGAFTPSQ